MTGLVSFCRQFCVVMRHFLEWKSAVMFYIVVMWMRPVFAGSYLRSGRIQIHWIRPDSDPSRIHQIHQISGRIRIWIRCTPNHHHHIIYRIQQYNNVNHKNSYTIGRLPEKPYCWLTGRPSNKWVFHKWYHTVREYGNKDNKVTKLCASAIGIYVQYHHLIYNSHTIQSK